MSQRDTGAHYENLARRHLERAGLVFKRPMLPSVEAKLTLLCVMGMHGYSSRFAFGAMTCLVVQPPVSPRASNNGYIWPPLFGWHNAAPVLPQHPVVLM